MPHTECTQIFLPWHERTKCWRYQSRFRCSNRTSIRPWHRYTATGDKFERRVWWTFFYRRYRRPSFWERQALLGYLIHLPNLLPCFVALIHRLIPFVWPTKILIGFNIMCQDLIFTSRAWVIVTTKAHCLVPGTQVFNRSFQLTISKTRWTLSWQNSSGLI